MLIWLNSYCHRVKILWHDTKVKGKSEKSVRSTSGVKAGIVIVKGPKWEKSPCHVFVFLSLNVTNWTQLIKINDEGQNWEVLK